MMELRSDLRAVPTMSPNVSFIIGDRDHYCWLEDLLSSFHITFVVEGNDTCLTVGDREIGSGLY